MSKFRPCIDIHDGKVKQIVGGSLTDCGSNLHTNFESKFGTSYYADLYKNDGLTGGHIIMLGSGNEQVAKEALSCYRGGLQIGGGITPDNAESWLEAGADKVIATSCVFSHGELNDFALQTLVNRIGVKNLVLDLSCRFRDGEYYIVTDRWQCFTKIIVNKETLSELANHCAEFLIHAVDVEGKQAGIDRDLLEIMSEYSQIPTTYAGGIRSMSDIALIEQAGHGNIDYTVGSALDIFGGSMSYQQLVDHNRGE